MKQLVTRLCMMVLTLTAVSSASAEEARRAPSPGFSRAALTRLAPQVTVSRVQPRSSRPNRRAGSVRAVWTVLGALGGGFAGAYVGAAIEGDCACDDPGVKGAFIGLPVGALAGGLAGFVLSR